jgi:hypothetical protein
MKRYLIVAVMLLGAGVYAQRGGGQAPPEPQGRGGRVPSPEQLAALEKQEALEKATPQIPFEAVSMPLVVPGHTIGETSGVAVDSKKHLYVYTRSGNAGPARGATAAQIFEFDQSGKFVKQWGTDAYGLSYAHDIRVDRYDNVWAVDEGSGVVIKFNPQGLVTMVLGRKPEAIDYLEHFLERGEKNEDRTPSVGRDNVFNRPTDVAWDTQDNIYVSDGYGNSRVAKFTKEGDWVKAVGTRGNGPLQFSTPHGIGNDAKGNIYVADRGNNRIQVIDPDLKLLKTFTNVRAPWLICISPGPKQYLFTADGSSGHIYKLDLDGNLVGWFGTIGKRTGQFYWAHQIACPSENELYVGEVQNWRVQHVTLKPGARSTNQ